jgi:riboflavin synthase
MFTGLIEEKGFIKEKIKTGDGIRFVLSAKRIMDDLKIGDSVAVNGVCLTVVQKENNTFAVDTIEETLKKTNLGSTKLKDPVNLERPLKADARLGGHFVLGHVDTTGTIKQVKELSNSHFITITFPGGYQKYLIPVGSISIDGVSMTVAELHKDEFSVGVIPHTWEETIFADKKVGDTVNLEFDVLGKYIIQLTEQGEVKGMNGIQ